MKKILSLLFIVGMFITFSCQDEEVKKKSQEVVQEGNPEARIALSNPTITSISPTSGFVGTPITITGTGYEDWYAYDIPSATINGVFCPFTYAQSNGSTIMHVNIPSGATSGTICVTNTDGAVVCSSQTFTVLVQSITSFSPANGAAYSNVVITGENFGANPVVKFNGVTAAVQSGSTSTSITAQVPQSATDGKISVTSNGFTAESATNFTVSTTINSFSPSSGSANSSVTISGSGFSITPSGNTVKFRGYASDMVATVTAATATQLTVTVPPGAVSGPIKVTKGSGNTAESVASFTVVTYSMSVNLVKASSQAGSLDLYYKKNNGSWTLLYSGNPGYTGCPQAGTITGLFTNDVIKFALERPAGGIGYNASESGTCPANEHPYNEARTSGCGYAYTVTMGTANKTVSIKASVVNGGFYFTCPTY